MKEIVVKNLTVFVLICAVLILTNSTIMFPHSDNKSESVPWIDYVNQMTINQRSGVFAAFDRQNEPIIFSWEKIAVNEPAFLEQVKNLRYMVTEAHTPVAVKFLQKNPEIVSCLTFFKPLAPLFENGVNTVDWDLIAARLKESEKHSINEVLKNYGQQDICWFVIAKGPTGPIGYAEFIVTPDYEWGTIKIARCMVLPHAQRRGVGKLLASSIFYLCSALEIKRVILRTLEVNEQAIAAYAAYGFRPYQDQSKFAQPVSWSSYSVFMEYLTSSSDILQKESKKLYQLKEEQVL